MVIGCDILFFCRINSDFSLLEGRSGGINIFEKPLDFPIVYFLIKIYFVSTRTFRPFLSRVGVSLVCRAGKIMASIPTSKYLEQLVTSPQGFRFQVYLSLKRLIDVVISAIFLLILSPVMLLIAIGIKLDSRGPVIFSQTRIGSRPRWLDGKLIFDLCPFTMYKFRTMRSNTSEDTHREFIEAFICNDHSAMKELQKNSAGRSSAFKLSHDPRVTPFGKLLRKSSLDELPQIWNILKNDMSLVGPRPALPYEVKMYQAWHYERLQAKPGLTGLWQVTARSSVEFDDMVKLDIQYVKERNLFKDLWIILKTPFVVISGKGAA